MNGAQELKELIKHNQKSGDKILIATSQYAQNVVSPDTTIHYHTSPAAVRSLIKQGIIEPKTSSWWRAVSVTVTEKLYSGTI